MSNLLKKKSLIVDWLEKYKIKKYELCQHIDYGFVVNVEESVDLYNQQLDALRVKFNKVSGYFNCARNNLLSLEGSPEEVGCLFNCSDNQLSSLQYSPQKVGGVFDCSNNKISSLKHCSVEVDSFYCSYNELTSLEYCPSKINSGIICSHNYLKNLKGCPNIELTHLIADNNSLTSLEGCPSVVRGNALFFNNSITSIKYAPQTIEGIFNLEGNGVKDVSLEDLPKTVGGIIILDKLRFTFDELKSKLEKENLEQELKGLVINKKVNKI